MDELEYRHNILLIQFYIKLYTLEKNAIISKKGLRKTYLHKFITKMLYFINYDHIIYYFLD